MVPEKFLTVDTRVDMPVLCTCNYPTHMYTSIPFFMTALPLPFVYNILYPPVCYCSGLEYCLLFSISKYTNDIILLWLSFVH